MGYYYILTSGAITSPTTAPTRRGLKLMSQLLRKGTTAIENTTIDFIKLPSHGEMDELGGYSCTRVLQRISKD